MTENITYHEYPSRQDWLQARSKTFGATDLSHWVNGHHTPREFEGFTGNKYTDFGSQAEPVALRAYARKTSLEWAEENLMFGQMSAGSLSWHDNSLYTDGRIHASCDGLLLDSSGCKTLVEVKTMGVENYDALCKISLLDEEAVEALTKAHKGVLRDTLSMYCFQTGVNALLSGADRAMLLVAARPEDFSLKRLRVHALPIAPSLLPSWADVLSAADGLEKALDQPPLSEGLRALAVELRDAKLAADQAKTRLEELKAKMVEMRGDEPLEYGGLRFAPVVSQRASVDWKAFQKAHPRLDYDEFTRVSQVRSVRLDVNMDGVLPVSEGEWA